jgi:hypothetical protein
MVSRSPDWRFARDIWAMIAENGWHSLAVLVVTIVQEVTALWPVTLLGQFVDRLQSGALGNVVWLLLGASLIAPCIARANMILRHKMFYETDFKKRVEFTLRVPPGMTDIHSAAMANSRVVNAVSSLTNATFYVVGSFTPVVIKIVIVSGSLLAYNSLIGWSFLSSLLVPVALTILANDKQRKLRDRQYEIISEGEGAGTHLVANQDRLADKARFTDLMRDRKDVLFRLLTKSQIYLYTREAALVGSQFLVVLVALVMRNRLGITPGDFTRIVGYTTQVAVAFINAAVNFDSVVSYSRAYHVYEDISG